MRAQGHLIPAHADTGPGHNSLIRHDHIPLQEQRGVWSAQVSPVEAPINFQGLA